MSVPHPYADTRKKCLDVSYSSLTEGERWEWHADVYAFRRVYLGIGRDVRVSPCDPKGEWFSERMIMPAERWHRLARGEQVAGLTLVPA
ncbi:MAG TPA: hypothetical protein VFA12_20475 [Stellaceae bacterium]|nr:hypothetical protein [Stellaceae bacterium]